jgi:hypothetical protein
MNEQSGNFSAALTFSLWILSRAQRRDLCQDKRNEQLAVAQHQKKEKTNKRSMKIYSI